MLEVMQAALSASCVTAAALPQLADKTGGHALTVSIGMAKPTPALVPVGVNMAVFCTTGDTAPSMTFRARPQTCHVCAVHILLVYVLYTYHANQAAAAVQEWPATVACNTTALQCGGGTQQQGRQPVLEAADGCTQQP